MSIDLVIDGDYGKGEFRAIININTKLIPGRNITIISRLAHVQCRKDNDEITGNTVMAPIGDRLNNICAGNFLGWTHEGKTQFIILTHGCTLPPPRRGNIQFSQVACFFHWIPSFICSYTWKGGELATLVLCLHVGPIRMERPRPTNGN